jgi:uncharacterized protein (DUF2237 family)
MPCCDGTPRRSRRCRHGQAGLRFHPHQARGRRPRGAVCVVMTSAFLDFSKSRGNDLSTPMPELGFPGLKPGDRWCLCAPRWQEAFEASQAPRVVLRATHEAALTYCSLADLKRFAVDLA